MQVRRCILSNPRNSSRIWGRAACPPHPLTTFRDLFRPSPRTIPSSGSNPPALRALADLSQTRVREQLRQHLLNHLTSCFLGTSLQPDYVIGMEGWRHNQLSLTAPTETRMLAWTYDKL